ncbi:MAG TPA: hypothetical protein P5150_08910, partial [Candidatus Ratteibacteria bacterium]|nr:hypothetical protein [Candidatus Ratteibacteria bacterium]
LVDAGWYTRENAYKKLNSKYPDWYFTSYIKDLLPVYIKALESEDDSIRYSAVNVLKLIKDKLAIEGLIISLVDSNALVRKISADCLSAIDISKIHPGWHKGEVVKNYISKIISALFSENEDVRNKAQKLINKIYPNGENWIENKEIVNNLFLYCTKLLSSGNKKKILESKNLINKILDKLDFKKYSEKGILDFISALEIDNEEVREIVINILVEKNNEFLSSYPILFCRKCYLKRPAKIKIYNNIDREFIVCQHCRESNYLEKGVNRVIGVIGADFENFKREGDVVYINLWDNKTKRAVNADIDELEIRKKDEIDYAAVVDSICLELKNDISRDKGYLKTIPVVLKTDISKEVKDLLKKQFKEIRK